MNIEELRRLKAKGPYEHIMDGNFTMYDKAAYKRDVSLCGPDSIHLVSGNIIKFYRCKITNVFSIIPDK